jgi:copper chaperone CopZ
VLAPSAVEVFMAAEKFALQIDGMHCGSCVRRVTQALEKIPGTTVDSVDVGHATGTVDPEDTDVEHLVQAVKALGFEARAAGTTGLDAQP